MAQIGAELLIKTIDNIDKIQPFPQDHSQATYAPKLKKEDGRIDWQKKALFIERLVRAFNPWPSAFTFLREKRIKILKGKRQTAVLSTASFPGRIHQISKEGIEVVCGEGSLFLIKEMQPEGKKSMSAYAFSIGTEIKPGDAFF